MIKENLPKLKLNCPQSKSQLPGSFTNRHKVQTSHDNILEFCDQTLTPNRIKSKDQLLLIDESLDSKEISMRNGLYNNPYDEFNTYCEHLELASAFIKKNNPRLAFTLSRGIMGCSRIINNIKKNSENSKSDHSVALKKKINEKTTQTEKCEEIHELKEKKNEDFELFRSLSLKIEEINFEKVTGKLKDLHRSFKEMSTHVPELSKIPESTIFNVKDTIKSIENHIKGIKNDLNSQFLKRKILNIPKNISLQTENLYIEPAAYNALEKLLIKKEEEMFE